jgi:hypothetical protein
MDRKTKLPTNTGLAVAAHDVDGASTAVVSRIPTKTNYIGYFVLGGYLVRNRCCAYFCLSGSVFH